MRAANASNDAEEEKEHLTTGSEGSTASFDMWAFDISDSRTLAQQQKMTALKKDSSIANSMTSSQMRKAEELASDWLTDKKVVRFNLDKNEVFT